MLSVARRRGVFPCFPVQCMSWLSDVVGRAEQAQADQYVEFYCLELAAASCVCSFCHPQLVTGPSMGRRT